MLALRDYQHRAVGAIRDRFHAGVRRLLVVSPTGSGKTVIAVFVLKAGTGQGRRMLFLAHRAELITQTSKKLDQVGIPHGIIAAGHKRYDPTLPMQVASIPTLFSRIRKGDPPPADIVVVDEAHHSEADTYRVLLEVYPEARILGFTATPYRTDGRGLEDSWDDLVVVASPRELIERGYLSTYKGFTYEDPEVDLDALQVRDGEVDATAFARRVLKSKIMGGVVERYVEHAMGRRGIVFACTKQHSLALRERFAAAGVVAEHVDGTMKAEHRAAVLERLQAGVTQIVCNVNVLTEGVDVPAAEVCILARPTLSTALYMQMAGRVLRLSPETGKTHARIHDHVGAMLVHGLPDDEREYTLEPSKPVNPKDAAERVRTCQACGHVYGANNWTCPECRKDAPNERLANERPEEGQLVPVEKLQSLTVIGIEQMKAELARIQSQARATGRRPGWVAQQFKMKYGRWPDPRWLSG